MNMAAPGDSSGSSVRKRRVDSSKRETKWADGGEENGEKSIKEEKEKEKRLESLQTGTYWLTRIVLLRSVAFIYCKHADCPTMREMCCEFKRYF